MKNHVFLCPFVCALIVLNILSRPGFSQQEQIIEKPSKPLRDVYPQEVINREFLHRSFAPKSAPFSFTVLMRSDWRDTVEPPGSTDTYHLLAVLGPPDDPSVKIQIIGFPNQPQMDVDGLIHWLNQFVENGGGEVLDRAYGTYNGRLTVDFLNQSNEGGIPYLYRVGVSQEGSYIVMISGESPADRYERWAKEFALAVIGFNIEVPKPADASTTTLPAPSKVFPGLADSLKWITVSFFILSVLFIFFFAWKKRGIPSKLTRILGWYTSVASLIGTATGIWFLRGLDSLMLQIFMFTLILLIGSLGVIAGGMLFSGRSYRPARWWGFVQLPWLSFNLHWFIIEYHCSFLLGVPFYVLLEWLEKWQTKFGLLFHFGIDFKLWGELGSEGKGFTIGLGMNFVALLYLLLLWRSQKQKA